MLCIQPEQIYIFSCWKRGAIIRLCIVRNNWSVDRHAKEKDHFLLILHVKGFADPSSKRTGQGIKECPKRIHRIEWPSWAVQTGECLISVDTVYTDSLKKKKKTLVKTTGNYGASCQRLLTW